jgi:hypothetical protein
VGGDRLDYNGENATSTVDITTFKILINCTLSTKDAKMMMMDINNYYLGTPLPTYEYMRLTISILPGEVHSHGQLQYLLGYLRCRDTTGQLIKMMMEFTQLEYGCTGNAFEQSYKKYARAIID